MARRPADSLTDPILLACEHYTTMAENNVHTLGVRNGSKLWCEKCGNWRSRKPRPKVRYPDVPPF